MIDAPIRFLLGAHHAQILQILERRIDSAGTGDVPTGRALFKGFDDLVAVSWSIPEGVEKHVARFAAPGDR